MASPISHAILETLPGWEIVSLGLADASKGRVTPASCAVWIARARLGRDGLLEDSLLKDRIENPEDVLYDLLRQEGGNAYGRYNALLRRLVKFEHALDRISVASAPV
jgi:hypothetical protein